MARPAPIEVYQNPSKYVDFLTAESDDNFEGQHYERKEVAHSNQSDSGNQLKNFRKKITKTISAFANSNQEGGLLVLGISSHGIVTGIDNLTEEQQNSLSNFDTLLNNHTADAKQYSLTDDSGDDKTVLLIFVPHSANSICETPGQNPSAWCRRGLQNISMTHELRNNIRTQKGLLDFDDDVCCEFSLEVIHKLLTLCILFFP